MRQQCFFRALIPVFMLLALASCAGPAPVDRSITLDHSALLAGSPFGLTMDDRLKTPDLLAVNDEMRAFLAERVPEGISDQRKSDLILAAILADGLQLKYSSFKTYTAQETFATREGNCLSFTNLYIALAREAGVRAYYQEVDMPPTWTSKGRTYMFNLHVNVLVKIPGRERVIDFDEGAFNLDYGRRAISDEVVLAQYHNNLSVHLMTEGDLAGAFQHIREALLVFPDTDYFWTTLGTVYRRAGYLREAEAAYLVALTEDDEPTALSNLARLYTQIEQPELANYYRGRVEKFRRQNPYYLYDLAELAYEDQLYSDAEDLLRKSIRLYNGDPEFYRLLGLTYVQMNELDKARKRFEQAHELVTDEKLRGMYQQKLQLLAGH